MTLSLDTVRIAWHPTKFEKALQTLNGPNIDKRTGRPYTPALQHTGTLREFLDTEFNSDAHATCYNVEGMEGWPLITKGVLKELEAVTPVTTPVLCFDYDWDLDNHSEWTEEAYSEHLERFLEATEHPVLGKYAAMYVTRGGLRIIYILDRSVPVEEAEQYLAYMFSLFKTAGFPVDENCKDWTRRFRCPRVLRDGYYTSKAWYFDIWEPGEILEVDSLEKMPTRIIPRHVETNVKDIGQPSHDEVEDLMTSKSPHGTGNRVRSSFSKDAQKALRKCRWSASLFKEDVPLCGPGQRNDTLCRCIGEAVPKLLREIPYLSPAHVYALFHGPVSQFENDQDWYSHTWNIILDIWGKETAKFNREEEAKAERELQTFTEIQTIAENMKKWCADPALEDPETAEEFVRRHALANIGRFFFLIGMDGCYAPFPVTRDQIISRIRTTYLNNILPTKTYGASGQLISMSVSDIQNEYATPIETVELRPQFDMEGVIEDMNGMHPKLVSPMYRRNPELEPTYDNDVDEWLAHFFGHYNYEQGCNWIANALAFEEGPICALSLSGPPGTGKKLLTMGLAECLEKPYMASGASICGNWNDELARTPFLVINEGLPKSKGSMPFSELFKSITAADPITVQERFKPNVQIVNPMRVIFTANNQDIIYQLVRDKELTPEDRQAVGQRLLHFDQDAGAAQFLIEQGEYRFTGRNGRRWIANGVLPSNYVVAKHFLWLHDTRIPVSHQGRYLITGNSDGDTSALQDATAAKETTADTALSIIQIVEQSATQNGVYMDPESGALYVTVNTVKLYVKTMLEKEMSFFEVSQAMRNIELCGAIKRDDVEWHAVDCAKLLNLAEKWGIPCDRMRGLVKKQIETGYLK